MEALDPTVRAILEDVVLRDDGAQFIDNYAGWIVHLRGRRGKESGRVFVQLAVLARQFLEADCKLVAVNLSVLARIGLPSSKPRITQAGPPTGAAG